MPNLFRKIREAAYPGLSIAAAAVVPCLTVFLNNRGHFTIRTGAAFGLALIVTAGIVLVCSIPLLLLGERRGRGVLTAFLQALAVTMILQYYFWAPFFPQFDRTANFDWDLLLLVVFHILALLLPFVVMIFFRAKIRRWSGRITAVIVLSQLVMLIGPLLEKPETPDYDFRDYSISEEGKFTFASKRNIIIVVVDCMGERIGKEVLRKYPELQHSLRDFSCFDRISSPLPRTMYAVPAMLSGIDFPRKEDGQPEETDDHAEYLHRVYRAPDSLFQLCRKHGWRREGYPFMLQTLSYSPEVIDNAVKINYQTKKQSAVKIFDSVLENLVPFFLHSLLEEYYYIATDQFITPMEKRDSSPQEPYDIIFYSRLRKEFQVGKFPEGMKYLHLHGAHEPVRTDDQLELSPDSLKYRQLRGSLKIIELLIEKLKQAGLYDDATIVITGDHTERYTPEILMLIKRPGERHETMMINSVPGQVSDLAGTVAKCSGLDPQARSLFDLPPRSGSLQSIRVNDISILDFPAWQPLPTEQRPAFAGGIEVPFELKNRHIVIDLAHEKLANLQSIVLTAENLLTGYRVQTTLTLSKNTNYARCDTSTLPKGVYRIAMFFRTEAEGDTEQRDQGTCTYQGDD